MQRGRSGRSFIALHTATCDRQPIPQLNAGRSLNQMRGAFSMRGTFSTFPIATGFLWLYSGITRYNNRYPKRLFYDSGKEINSALEE